MPGSTSSREAPRRVPRLPPLGHGHPTADEGVPSPDDRSTIPWERLPRGGKWLCGECSPDNERREQDGEDAGQHTAPGPLPSGGLSTAGKRGRLSIKLPQGSATAPTRWWRLEAHFPSHPGKQPTATAPQGRLQPPPHRDDHGPRPTAAAPAPQATLPVVSSAGLTPAFREFPSQSDPPLHSRTRQSRVRG